MVGMTREDGHEHCSVRNAGATRIARPADSAPASSGVAAAFGRRHCCCHHGRNGQRSRQARRL